MKKTRIGVVGCGNISDIYLKNLTSVFENTQVYAVSDLDRSRAEASAARYGVPHVMDVEELLACPEAVSYTHLALYPATRTTRLRYSSGCSCALRSISSDSILN